MIQFANQHTMPLVRQMWKTCFGDDDDFLDILFKYKYRNENTLIYFEDGIAVASLQMLPYTITFYGEEIPFAYLAGLCTLPEYRKKGFMAKLIHRAHEIMRQREIPLSILVPAEDWLYGFYEKYGYEKVFENGNTPLYPLKKILIQHPDLEEAYTVYDAMFREKDFCVQKTFCDFKAIVEEQILDGFPEKYDIAGMARIMDREFLLGLYSKKNPDKEKIEVEDERLLCRLLFGYKTDELEEPYRSLFPVHHPVMNQMLE
ncbi:GNAT family N-acetyltransferase [Prevotella sp. 10(H)]|uniref:GNAT family N-acetyltransferase n=1 Tax=Prevotella sp. 10(H) TaxID=1158294 RepID=UPI0004A71A39|nr:GNAT family N-acetyltransferase [Prevotella sp. 10(H)]